MTRRKKTKAAQGISGAAGLTSAAAASANTCRIALRPLATGTIRINKNNASTLNANTAPTLGIMGANSRVFTSSYQSQGRSANVVSAASTTNSRSSASSSIVTEDVSTSSLETNDKKLTKPKPKRAVKTIVKYVTKQIHVYPMHPILTVERLPNLEYHVGVLTETIGRRPSVYQHGKGVRFVPHSSDEYRIIQRYLARIETSERISWCVHSLPPGNSLKVNIKVREVEYVKINDDFAKLSIKDSSNLGNEKSIDIKINSKYNSSKRGKPSREDILPKGDRSKKDTQPKDLNSCVPNSEIKDDKSSPLKDRSATAAKKELEIKKPKDIRQNRSYKSSSRT